jgi:hypothetical protein
MVEEMLGSNFFGDVERVMSLKIRLELLSSNSLSIHY